MTCFTTCQIVLQNDDLIRQIFDFLPLQDLPNIKRVCKIFNIALSDHLQLRITEAQYHSILKDRSFKKILSFIKELNFSRNFMLRQPPCSLPVYLSPNVEIIDLKGHRMGDAGLKKLSFMSFYRLKTLSLQDNQITEISVEHLNKVIPKSITYLDLAINELEDLGISKLNLKNFPNLTALNLFKNSLSSKSILHLQLSNCPNLNFLSLDSNPITDLGIQFLCKQSLKNFTFLGLAQTQITNKSITYLSQTHLANLKALDISHNQISDLAAILFASNLPPSLRVLAIEGNNLSDETKKTIELMSKNLNKLIL